MAEITLARTDGGEAGVPGAAVDDLARRLGGGLIRPGDASFDTVRALWNGMIDRRPALIARCAAAADAAACVRFAREHDVLVSVRGGGHGVAGHALAEGGLVVDLSALRGVEVDPARGLARAQGGCTLGDVDRATEPHGLAAPLGVVSETGIAGLTLSGGIGWLRRKHGLSCDNVVSAELVTADGDVLTVSEAEQPDLFWAIRGGGGNFGIVTAFDYRLHPVGPHVALCYALYPAARARDVLRGCEQYLADAPEDVAPLSFLGHAPPIAEVPAESHGKPFVAVMAVHPGAPADGERALRPLRELAEPIVDFSGTMPYTDAQAALDEDYPNGWRYYWKSLNVGRLTDGAIDRLVELAAAAPSPASTVDVWFQGGAMARVGEEETAFANRSQPYLLGIEGNWQDESADAENVAWVRDAFAAMRAFSDGGVYLNFPGFLEEGAELLREGYGRNLRRLSEVKARYDPANVFRLNANVPPGREAA